MKIKNLYSALGAVGMVALSGIILNGSLMLGGSAFAETIPSEDFEIAVEDDLTTQADDADDDADADTYTAADFGNDEGFFECVKSSAGLGVSDATEIDKAKVVAITEFTCSGAISSHKIKGTSGIELLTGLTKVEIANQDALTSIDLTKNNKLTEVWITDNEKLATVKLGDQPNLTTLWVYNNSVSSIDLDGSPALQQINLYNNKLAKIDLSKNTKATSVTISGNQLENIDLSQNKALIILYAYGNKIEYLDTSKINTSLKGLYLDDNVLVRTNFVAVQLSKGANFYAAPSTNPSGMFIPMQIATGLGEYTEITTEGAHYYNALKDSSKCANIDAWCIVFDANILNYQDYVQLKYIGDAASDAAVKQGQDETKRNYRLEINLEAWKEQAEGGDIKVPDTGASTGSANAVIIAASLGALALVSGGAYLAVYTAKRAGHKVSFKK